MWTITNNPVKPGKRQQNKTTVHLKVSYFGINSYCVESFHVIIALSSTTNLGFLVKNIEKGNFDRITVLATT